MSTETQVVKFEPQLLDELNLSQRLAAKFLEVGYLKLQDFPDIAKKIRMTADDAQTQHMMTLGLMKKFKVTAEHVVVEMIPLIQEGIELQVPEMAQEAMETVIGYAKEMNEKTKETQKRYYEIKAAVQGHIADVEKENLTVTRTKKDLQIEADKQLDSVKMMGGIYKDLEKENEDLREQIKKSQEARREYLARSIPTENDKDILEGFFDDIMVPAFTVFTMAAGGPVAGLIFAGASWTVNYLRRNDDMNRAVQASEKEENWIEHLDKKKEKKSERMRLLQEDALDKIAYLRKLTLEKVSLGDVEDLKLASDELAKVGFQLSKIALFWEDFAAKLEGFVKSQNGAKIMLHFIQKPGVVEKFNKRLDIVAKSWEGFGGVCVSYVDKHSEEIASLYKFLTSPVERLSIKERADRQEKLLDNIEAEIMAIKF